MFLKTRISYLHFAVDNIGLPSFLWLAPT